MNNLTSLLSWSLASQAIPISAPYILAALGGTLSEIGGVVNIALEGLILFGAFCAVVGTYYSGSPWIGLLCAMAGGAALAWVHAFASIRYRCDQIISGLAINLAAAGLTKFFLKMVFRSSSNSTRIPGLPAWDLGPITALPVVGQIISHPLLLLSAALIIAAHLLVFKTPFGLRLRAVGEHPACAETLGISVYRMRYAGVILSGILAALAGAWLAFDQHEFSESMSGGRGYIALTAVIFGKWTPLGAAAAAVLFGVAESFQIQLQTIGVQIPTQFIQMIPYLLTIVVLAGVIGRARPPAADGVAYPEKQ